MLCCNCSGALSAEPPSSKLSPATICLRARRLDTTADSSDTCLAGRHPKIGRLRLAGKGGVVGIPSGALIDRRDAGSRLSNGRAGRAADGLRLRDSHCTADTE